MDARMKWAQLSEQDRRRLLDEHRDPLDYSWWYAIYEVFREDMEAIGVHVSRIYFSGFWSQGSGACFEGYVDDWGKFLPAVGAPELARAAASSSPNLSWYHSGHYYHEYCVRFDEDLCITNPYDEERNPLRFAAWEALYPGEDGPLVDQSDHMADFLRSKMRDLYALLEEEHEYLTGDEMTLERILEYYEDAIDALLEEESIDTV